MLSIGRVRESVTGKPRTGLDYYTQEQKLDQDDLETALPRADEDELSESAGRWIGPDLAAYGLNPDTKRITTEQLRRVLTGLHAGTGEPLPGGSGGLKALTRRHRVRQTVTGVALQPDTVQIFPSGKAGKAAALAAQQSLGAGGVLRRSENGRGWTVGRSERDVNGAVVLAPITVGKNREGVLGYDLSFSAPKSVSVLALTEREAVRRAHEAAVETAMGWGADQIGWSRAGHGGGEPVAASVGAAAVFTHAQSRDGDPQLHTHVLVPNRVLCVDGVWRALDGRTVWANAAAIGAVYQAALRAELTADLGVAWTDVSDVGFAEVQGVPTGLLELWSSRSATVSGVADQVLQRAEFTRAAQGRAALTKGERAQIRDAYVLKTRPTKAATALALADGRTVTERWVDQAAASGHPLAVVQTQITHKALEAQQALEARELARLAAAIDFEAMAAGVLTRVAAKGSTFSRATVRREAARLHPAGGDPKQVGAWVDRVTDLALSSDECLQVAWDGVTSHVDADLLGLAAVTGRPGLEWFTTRGAMTVENRITDRAVVNKNAGWGVVPTDVLGHTLNDAYGVDGLVLTDGQLLAVDGLTGSGDGVEVLDVSAGPGKNLVVGRAAMAWRANGQRVVVVSPQAEGAKVLAGKTGVDVGAGSVAQMLNRWETAVQTSNEPDDYTFTPSGHAAGETDATPWRVDARTVIIVDHASTLTTDQIDRLTAAADRGHAKLVLLGDTSSLSPSKATTGMFRSLRDAVGGRTMTVDHSLAGRKPWEASASQGLRDGNPKALDGYQTAGRLHAAPDREAGITEAVDQYQAGQEEGRHTLIVTGDRGTATDVNTAIAERTHAGMKPLDVQRIGERNYAEGDPILLRSTDTRLKYGLSEGKHGLAQAERNLTGAYDTLRDYQGKKSAAWTKLRKATPGVDRAVTKARIAILDTRISTTGTKITDLKGQVAVLRAEREMAPYVRAGARATITSINTAGAVTATETLADGTTGATFTLPRSYVHQHVDHAFAMTVTDATRTGVEPDRALLVGSVERGLNREAVYGGLTIGATSQTVVWDEKATPENTPRTAQQILTDAMSRSGADVSVAERKTMLAQDRHAGDVKRMRTVAGRGETLVEIADRKHALTERVIAERNITGPEADPALVRYFTEALAAVDGGPAAAKALTGQDGWGVVLAGLEATGHDQGVEGTKALLVAAIQDRPLDLSRPVGPVLDHRLRGADLDGAGQRVTTAEQELRRWTVRAEQVEAGGQPATRELALRDKAAANVVHARAHANSVNPLHGANKLTIALDAEFNTRYANRLHRDTDKAITAGTLTPTIGHRPENQPDANPETQTKIKTAQTQWRTAAEADVEYRARWIDRGPQRLELTVMLPEQATAQKALTAATDLARTTHTAIIQLGRRLTQGITRDGGLSM